MTGVPDGRLVVTGASGFLGAALTRVFAAEGFAVTALVRRTSPRTNLDVPGVALATGDLSDPASLRAALGGAKILVHAAADYRLWTRDPAALIAANVEGTRNVLRAAADAGVERVVYTSSVAALTPGTAARPSDERDGAAPETAIGPYKRSKVLAERVAGEFTAAGLPVVVVNPSTPIGPRDVKPTPTGRIIVEAARGRIPAYVDTGLNLAHVDDVARGHLLALRYGRAGERYILGGENVRLVDMLAEIARLTGRKAPRRRLPLAPLMPLAIAAEAVAALSGRPPFVTRDGVRMARQEMFFSDARARAELGYTSRAWQEGIADALAWFHAAGMISRPARWHYG